ncbi:hypothetical protein RHMOL_Rhmol13G0221000 [Rhododendron molle]|uniref:Uncharacterized protein n=1 Tax=Rhododendron molle TaxID=49168 RepID=A0ACC0L9X3_RHOML|nr:hypothetical protein RHMOL_Rhmol13G0221000 [Rhododendron molle]
MEHSLCEAATRGNIDSLKEIIGKDELILDRVAAGCSSCTSPLHVATSNNRLDFVVELLLRKPELAEVLDSQLRSALHLASAKGHYEIAKALVKANPEMCLVRDREGKNPLHLAAVKGNFNVLKELVGACPQAARERVDRNETILHLCVKHSQGKSLEILLETIQGEELVNAKDNDGNTVLHLAALDQRLEVHYEIVKALVKANPEMCLVRDREGKNPLHLAAVKGNFNVLKELVGACPQAARERVDRNETILHLCVKHNQGKSLEILLETIQGEELVNAKDNDGNTVLHLAALDQKLEITSHVLKNQTVDVNVENASGHTAMDILIRVQMSIARSDKKESCVKEDTQDLDPIVEQKKKDLDRIKDLLRGANAKRAKDLVGGHWLKKKKNSLMVVASLIATMAFQAGVNPPGGVWQDNSHGHRAGEAVMAYNYEESYPFFLRFNTIGFVASLSTILLLISGLKFKNKATMWILIVSMWLAITSMAITYAFSNVVITPKKGRRPLTNTIVIAVIVWSSVMTLLLLKHTYHLVAIFVEEERSKKNATKRNMEFKRIMELNQQSLSNGWSILRKRLRLGDGGAKPPLPVSTEMH